MIDVKQLRFPNLRAYRGRRACRSDGASPNGIVFYCSRRLGHTGRHHAAGPTIVLRVWS